MIIFLLVTLEFRSMYDKVAILIAFNTPKRFIFVLVATSRRL